MAKNENSKVVRKNKKKEAARIMSPAQLKKCNAAIHSAAVAAGAAGAIPIPVADAAPITAAQITMVLTLGKIFKQSVTKSSAKAILSAAASTIIGRSAVKIIPIVGWGISAGVAAGVTEAIGWTTAVDFAKTAKLQWQKEHTQPDAAQNSTSTEKSEPLTPEQIKASLLERAQPFLDGAKTPKADKEVYNAWLRDYEDYIKIVDNDEELTKIYHDFTRLGMDDLD